MNLKEKYFMINFLSKLNKEYGDDNKAKDEIIKLKREVRDYFKRTAKSDRTIVKDNGIDGYVELIELPDFIKNTDDAKEYFEEEEYIRPFYSLYDCTGRPFTGWYKIIQRRGKFFAYHDVAFDV